MSLFPKGCARGSQLEETPVMSGSVKMDEAELARRTFNLVDTFSDRVPEPDLRGLRSMAGGGEWDELLSLLIAALSQTRASVTAQERDELRDILAGWGMPPDPLGELATSA